MKKRTISLLLATFCIAVLALVVSWRESNVIKQLSIPLDSPEARPIKDAVVQGIKTESFLFCNPDSDVNLLDKVYIDTFDYRLNRYDKILIARYLGVRPEKNYGYLSFIKAYHLWARTDDTYPTSPLGKIDKGVRLCPNPLPEPQVAFESIALQNRKTIVIYSHGAYQTEAVLIAIDDGWFISSSRNLKIIF